MDPTIKAIVLGICINTVTSVVGYIGRKGPEIWKDHKKLKRKLEKDPSLIELIEDASNKAAKSALFNNQIREFLTSPNVNIVARQIYASQLTPDTKGEYLKSIRDEFSTYLSLHLKQPKSKIKDITESLWNALFLSCERSLEISIEEGNLFAHEAKSAARHRAILDELSAIHRNISVLKKSPKTTIHNFHEFEIKYRQQVQTRHAHITPPHVDTTQKIPINDLYVAPCFTQKSTSDKDEKQQIDLKDFLSVAFRSVVLGNPGAGKSTLSHYLAYNLTKNDEYSLLLKNQTTPIVVVLRDYGAEKKESNCSILQFLEKTANSIYQVQPPKGFFEYMFLNGRAIVVFDGLDELLDTNYRQQITGDVELFANLYPSLPILVTSREVGYEQAPLDTNRFDLYRISDFNENQVEEYCNKWFSTDTELTKREKDKKIKSFISESKIAVDLRSNPLMLALMCNIYRGENYIPRNRPDLYEKCALMLFERWDKGRGINVTLPFEAHIDPAMKYLAFWIYSDESLQGGVTEEKLIIKSTEYLFPKRFEDREEAKNAAKLFVDFCRGRAWVFTDTGTTKDGDKLYQFTHRTFLEYFAASHLVRINNTPKSLGKYLLPRIGKREWDVVAQLAFQLQNKRTEGAADEMLSNLINKSKTASLKRSPYILSFAARCLEFIVPSPKVSRSIVDACIDYTVSRSLTNSKRRTRQRKRNIIDMDINVDLSQDFANTASENIEIITDAYKNRIAYHLMQKNTKENILSLEITWHTNRLGYQAPLHADLWNAVSTDIFQENSDKILSLCPNNIFPSLKLLFEGSITIDSFIQWHGIPALFKCYGFITLNSTWLVSPVDFLLSQFFEVSKKSKSATDSIKQIGHLISKAPLPIKVKSQSWEDLDTYVGPLWIPDDKKDIKTLLKIDPETFFGVFVLIAIKTELTISFLAMDKKRLKGRMSQLKDRTSRLVPFNWLPTCRTDKYDEKSLLKNFKNHNILSEHRTLIMNWAQKKFDLISLDIP
ncbi:NACHT domain-containing protein [Nitrospinota bacterium]